MRTRKVFLTFGGGSEVHRQSAYRLKADVVSSEVFDEVHAFTDFDLEEGGEFSDFSQSHGEFIARSARGYGYWLWKPYLIRRLFERLNEGDIVVYVDAGCELNPDIACLQSLLDRTANQGLTVADARAPLMQWNSTDYLFENGTLLVDPGHDHNHYVKADLLLKFKATSDSFDRQMCVAGIVAYRKSPEIVGFVDAWYQLAQVDNYHFLDDSPSVSPDHPKFVEHRHDQAIFSLLLYSTWPRFEFSVLPYLAFKPLRNRSGKDSAVLAGLIKESIALEIPRHLVKLARTSSSSRFSRSAEDPYNFIFSPIRSFLFTPAAPDFAFHTEMELKPYWECLFEKPIYVDRLIVFNRPGYEQRAVPLSISAYDALGNVVPLMRVELPFGGAHDKSPLIVELGSRIGRFSGIKLQVEAENPTHFHLARIMICVPKWDL